MSCGPGWLQRAIIELLEREDRRMDTFDVTRTVFDIKPGKHGCRTCNDAQYTAVRRALMRLANQGKITALGRGWVSQASDGCRGPEGRKWWASNSRGPQIQAEDAALRAAIRRHCMIGA